MDNWPKEDGSKHEESKNHKSSQHKGEGKPNDQTKSPEEIEERKKKMAAAEHA